MNDKQRTFYVGDKKVQIKTRRLANARGFFVFINGQKFFSNRLDRDEAEEGCYAHWVRQQPVIEEGVTK